VGTGYVRVSYAHMHAHIRPPGPHTGLSNKQPEQLASVGLGPDKVCIFLRWSNTSNFRMIAQQLQILCYAFLLFVPCTRSYNWPIWNCKGQEWEIDTNPLNNGIISQKFQRWITAMQYTCSAEKPVYTMMHTEGGFAHHMSQAASQLISSIEINQIYRPDAIFKWSEFPANCTFGKPMIDCFFEPISPCFRIGTETQISTGKFASSFASLGWNITEGMEFGSSMDTCRMAMLSKKSLQWVGGQFYLFIMRLRKDIEIEVNELVNRILNQYNHESESYIAWNMRGGNPDGADRVGKLNVTNCISYIDRMAADMTKRSGKPVTLVYLASDHPTDNFQSADYMTRHFPRPWKYVELPHVILDAGEVEFALEKHTDGNTRRQMAVEFLADMRLFSVSDGFVGAVGNMYYVVTQIRAALESGYREHTCYIISHSYEFVCERSALMKSIQMKLAKGFYNKSAWA
jgi:hypothetical protein